MKFLISFKKSIAKTNVIWCWTRALCLL